jgi:ssDNA thymidine ADP-ribosyltransferase, DarT
MSITLNDFNEGDWQVQYSKGSLCKKSTGETFTISLAETGLSEEMDRALKKFLHQNPDISFAKAEYCTDGKLYLYADPHDPCPTAYDLGVRGGGDQVFLRMVGEASKTANIHSFPLFGTVQVLYDLSILNRASSHGYPKDSYGEKGTPQVENRKNLIQLAESLQSLHVANEVMVKNRIPPEFIIGVVVATEEQKKMLIQVLNDNNLVKEGRVNNILVERFVHVQPPNSPFTKAMWLI